MQKNFSHQLIGQILLKTGKVGESQLDSALKKQKSVKSPLGKILEADYSVAGEYINESLFFQEHQKESGIQILNGKIGELLKELDIINQDDISNTLEHQKNDPKPFGRILSENKIVRAELIDDLVEAAKGDSEKVEKLNNKKLGEVLLDLHMVGEKELSKALIVQKESNNQKKLGEILVEKGNILLSSLKKALKVQRKLASLTCITLMATTMLAGCATPRIPVQPLIGTVENYNGSLMKVLKTNPEGSVNYYNDGTVAISNVPIFQQGNDNTCGQAVMASILNYWGINVDYQQIVNDTNPGNLPTDVTKITSYLRAKGLHAQDYRKANLNFVKDRIAKGSPPIILLDFGTLATEHYVIATGFNDARQELIILDPIDGPNIRIPYFQVEKMWQNNSLKKLGIFGDKYDRIVFDISGEAR